MKDEIKEILEALENTIKDDRIPYEIESYECKILLDYITNLQEENKRLNANIAYLQKQLEVDYQSRNEKAIKYIKENCIDDEFHINLTNKEKNIIKALDILQGENNES